MPLLGAGHYKKEVNMPLITGYSQHFTGTSESHGSRASLSLIYRRREVAAVFFVPEGETIPNDIETSSGRIIMYMRESLLPNVIDMLRNEKPIFIRHFPSIQTTLLRTGKEPTGEEESGT